MSSDLPEEIWLQIFGNLSLPDQKSSALVCRRWRNIFFEYVFPNKTVTHLPVEHPLTHERIDFDEIIETLTKSAFKRRNIKFEIENLGLNYEKLNKLFEKHAANIRHLELTNVDAWLNYEFCKHLRNLNHLTIQNGDKSEQETLNFEKIAALKKIPVVNLKICDTKLQFLKYFMPVKLYSLDYRDESYYSIQGLEYLIENNKSLKSITIYGIQHRQKVIEMLKNEHYQLEKINFHGFGDNIESTFDLFMKNPNLKELSYEGYLDTVKPILICQTLKLLRKLDLNTTNLIHNSILRELKHLEEFSYYFWSRGPSDVASNGWDETIILPQIKSIEQKMGSKSEPSIFCCVPNLEKLVVNYDEYPDNDVGPARDISPREIMQVVALKCPNLKHLVLCKHNDTITKYLNNCKNLEFLKITQGHINIEETLPKVRLSNLKTLIYSCDKIKSKDIEAIGKNFKSLRKLYLYHSFNTKNHDISAKVIKKSILKKLMHLNELGLPYIPGKVMNEKLFDYIVKYGNNLKILDLYCYDYNVTTEKRRYLIDNLISLKQLNIGTEAKKP